MTTKVNGKASPKKEASKKASKNEVKADTSKQEKKSAKAVHLEEVSEAEAPSVDTDEIEEEEEAEAAGGGAGGNAAALAAAAGSGTEISASFKNFRHHPDMENFYRFIFENDLRHEALAIIDEIIVDKQQKRSKKP